MAGLICCLCENSLPDDPLHKHGERLCADCTAARTPKRKVRMFYIEMPTGLDICFVENNNQPVGKRLFYSDPTRIYDLLRAARSSVEDHQIVELALRDRRPGSVELSLTEEQCQKLKRSR
jgi:hypothetical protein